ncbi:hypothetical protein GJ744_012247 [Endocarpon pusillum]|uniref:Uncharacterized protein n=1 Tax=Endocarpon pusillum TaxID=364733 RepID=A0A8H7E492_9EURO|nr:hypothetical protein GJ744_012247 [Endocarpon pusillum]
MPSHSRGALQLRAVLYNWSSLNYLHGHISQHHEFIKRGKGVRQKSTIPFDDAQRGAKPVSIQDNKHACALNEEPPRPDPAFQIPENFSKFAPGLPINSSPAGTAAADVRSVLQKEKQKFLHSPDGLKCVQHSLTRITRNEGRKINFSEATKAKGIDCCPSIDRSSLPRTSSLGNDHVDASRGLEAWTKSICDKKSPSKSHRNQFLMHSNGIPTPSEMLLAALPTEAQKDFSSRHGNKMDLSHIAIRQWERVPWKERRMVKRLHAKRRTVEIHSPQKQPTKQVSLCAILARYIAARGASELRASEYIKDAEDLCYLHLRGYSPDHVQTWAEVLISSNANQAVWKFTTLADTISPSGGPSLPTFLLLFILRARSLKATSLRLLLDYIWTYYIGEVPRSEGLVNIRSIDDGPAMILVIRLIRHARMVWPNALEEIASIVGRLVGRESDGLVVNLSRHRIQNYSHFYNRLLSLFAMRTSLRPFASIAIQQRSQFCLIRKMTKFKPHLPVTREGFRALIKVQLAHKKTDSERDWATRKALSWPPWKEELLGIEADSEDPGKNSRAADVLLRMIEAGYSPSHWEECARVFAGWDTDGSPTIQTRTLLSPASVLQDADQRPKTKEPHSDKDGTWAARILATRTLKEAWGCFTAFEKFSGGTNAIEPHNAMLARLLHVKRKDDNRTEEVTSVVPGDGKETWPEPTSSHDFLYVSSDPPTVDDFFDTMIKRGLRPGVHLLAQLLDKATSIAEGLKYINASTLRQSEKDVLCGHTAKNGDEVRTILSGVPNHVIATYVRMLCRMRSTPGINFTLPPGHGPQETTTKEERTTSPFYYAQSFVWALQPSYRPIWYALLQVPKHPNLEPPVLQRLATSLPYNLRDMHELGLDLDFDGFRDIGRILEENVLGPYLVMTPQQQELCRDRRLKSVFLCKSLFNAMAHGGSAEDKQDFARSSQWLPLNHPSAAQGRTRLIHVPSPPVLHRTIRILGMGEDNASILTLLRWMDCFAPELGSLANELANSKMLVRETITAVRYLLEERWRYEGLDGSADLRNESQPAQKELLSEAKAIVEQHGDEWGGWSTDEELCRYHHLNRIKAGRLRENLGLAH